MVLSSLGFSLMSVMVALTADTIPLFEQLFFRNFIIAIIAFVTVKRQKASLFGAKSSRPYLVARSLTGFVGIITSFYASGNADQGDVSILTRMSPFIVTVLAVIFLKEKVTKYQIIALIIAFAGAVIVANPQMNSNVFPLFIALVSAVFGGVAYTMISLLKGKENSSTIVFYFSAFTTVLTIPMMLMDFVIPSLEDFIILILIGVFGGMGQLFITAAYTCAKASSVSIYNYAGIIFSMILGYALLGQNVGFASAIGAVLVVVAGFVAYKDKSK